MTTDADWTNPASPGPTFLPPPAAGTQVSPPAIPPSGQPTPPPPTAPMPPKRSPLPWVIGVVVLALIVAAIVFILQDSPGPTANQPPVQPSTQPATQSPSAPSGLPAPTATHTPGTWSRIQLALPAGSTNNIVDSGIDGLALLESNGNNGCTVTAIDLLNLAVLWTASTATTCSFIFPSAGGVVIETGSQSGPTHAQVLDPITGAVTADADLGENEAIMKVGDGIIYSQDVATYTACARTMSLGPCVWQGAGNSTFSSGAQWGGVFGDFSWISGTGVRDWHTGVPAPFGADASVNSGWPWITYAGPSKDRVLRVTGTTDGHEFALQPWDTAADKAAGQPLEADMLTFSDDTQTYVTCLSGLDNPSVTDQATVYSWTTGQKVFDVTLPSGTCLSGEYEYVGMSIPRDNNEYSFYNARPGSNDPYSPWLFEVGNAFWLPSGDDADLTWTAYSLSTGEALWNGIPTQAPIGITSLEGHSTVWTLYGSTVMALDANTVQPTLTIDLPGPDFPQIAGNRVVAIDSSTDTLWVLNQ